MTVNAPALFQLFAALDGEDLTSFLTPDRSAKDSFREILEVVAVLGLLALALILVVMISRRKKLKRLSGLSRSAWPARASRNEDPGGSSHRSTHHHHHRHRRRHRHEERPRNPTLADTGGLPPRRPADQPPPGP